ncbi:MAG: TonB-dependent receptor [Undibacterium sp.]|nr:TonB-dependent receptor [Undibacterium sp.]
MSKRNLVLKKTLVAHALTLAFSAGVLTVGVSSTAFAQSNATGTVFGRVAAGLGNSVIVQNKDTKLTRTVTPDAGGKFQATSLPTGQYKVTLMSGANVIRSMDVEVLLGQGVEATFDAVQSVEVSARRTRIDVSNTNNGASFTSRELAKLPITPSVASIIQLAPNTTRGDSRYGGGNAPSFGGASASENAFYINGFPVTNVLLQIGASELPFGSIGQAQILSGGYGAEFGRSTGGVVNITTKSGTNSWEVGGSASITPNALRNKSKNIYYPNTGASENVDTDGDLYLYGEGDKSSSHTLSAYVSGPLIQDKLFLFANVEQIKSTSEFARLSSASSAAKDTGWNVSENKTLRSLIKLDWNINDDHRLELTNITDRPESDRKYFGLDYATLQRGNVQNGGRSYENYGPTPAAAAVGADVSILKYTGNITKDLTLTALYGISNTSHTDLPLNYNPALLQTQSTPATRVTTIAGNYTTPQKTTGNILTPGAEDKQKVYRLDLEYKLGDHTLRAGLDHNDISTLAGTSRAGGGIWSYGKLTDPNALPNPQSKSPASGGGYGANGYFVQRINTSGVSAPTVEQSAQYIEDRYQVTKQILLSLGLRNEQFTNYNGDGQAYVSQRNQLAPRLGVAWDVNGDASLKAFGSAGRYHLQMPTNVAIRAAGSSLFTREYFTYTGVDATTGAPTGLTAISGVTSANNEFGQAKDPLTVAAQNMDAHFQDEISLGFEKAYSPSLNFGTKVTYRVLKSTIDDFCDQRPFDKWAEDNKVDATNYHGFGCALFNPGQSNNFLVNYNGDGKTLVPVNLTAAELGYPKVERKYTAVDFFVEHPLRNGWYGKLNYTWSRSKGNTEGQTLSDIGQADVATTQVFDYPEISQNANGLLPNDRTHQFKAYGFYEVTPQIGVGANLLLASGRSKNCIGNFPDDSNPAAAYGSAFFYCNGVATPRGSQGKLPWDTRLDMNLVYRPAQVKGLAFKFDVYNLFNRSTIQNIDEVYNVDTGVVSSTFGQAISYTTPRYAKLTVEYSYKF